MPDGAMNPNSNVVHACMQCSTYNLVDGERERESEWFKSNF